jgi:tRNA modification GTPase
MMEDTIVALATRNAPAARAIVRLSGPRSGEIVGNVFTPDSDANFTRNRLCRGQLKLSGVDAPLPATIYFFPAPHSYTGQEMAEIHTLSCPPLVDVLLGDLLAAGGRAAQGGEFTQRAFLAGKLDLTRAEAVHAVISASNRTELRQALAQLAGNMAKPLAELREDLLNLLADVEAGLDFADEDIEFIDKTQLLLRLGRGMAHVTVALKQLESRAVAGHIFRVVLAGRPNAGKSSLFNALTGTQALVSPQAGTTRDYLLARAEIDGTLIEFVDTPGIQSALDSIEQDAQKLGGEQQQTADLLLVCVPSDEEVGREDRELLQRHDLPALLVWTKADLVELPPTGLSSSTQNSSGIDELRQRVAVEARQRADSGTASSISRCRHHLNECLQHLRNAHAIALEDDPPEILALEVRETLQELGALVGVVYTEDLLDRIFSRFCIGK